MLYVFPSKLLLIIIQAVDAASQSFSQSFSSSSFVGPSGQVYQTSIYQDSQGNRVINGVPYRQAAVARPADYRPVAAAPVIRPVLAAPVSRPVFTAQRPAVASVVYATRATARPVQYQTTRAVQYQTTKRPNLGR